MAVETWSSSLCEIIFLGFNGYRISRSDCWSQPGLFSSHAAGLSVAQELLYMTRVLYSSEQT